MNMILFLGILLLCAFMGLFSYLCKGATTLVLFCGVALVITLLIIIGFA